MTVLKIIKNIGKIGLTILIGIILLAAIAVLIRTLIAGTIKSEHKITQANGIDEEVILSIGGINQYLYIRGNDINKPVILFLHGGPGGTMTSVLHAYQYPWEEDYTVVQWDQRVSGKTYFLNKDTAEELASQLSVDLLLDDLHEIVQYLNERFGKDRVIIVGHSWGSVLGSQFALKYPELTEAYVGVGQTVNITSGFRDMAQHVRSFAEKAQNEADIAAIDELIVSVKNSGNIPNAETIEVYMIAEKYNIPVDLNTSVFTKALLTSPYYSLPELFYYSKMEQLTEPLVEYLQHYDLNDYGTDYQVPVLYMLGDKDLYSRITAEKYFEKIDAPYKAFVLIENAGHAAMLDQPEQFFNKLREELRNACGSRADV